MASRVMGLCLRRLSADWQARLPSALARDEVEVSGPCPFRAPALESPPEIIGDHWLAVENGTPGAAMSRWAKLPALDILHVAAAKLLGIPESCSFDARQTTVAGRVGLTAKVL